MIRIFFRKIIARLIWLYYRTQKNKGLAMMFIPHPGFSKCDYIDIFNYKSDSAMTFARYMLDNHLFEDREFIVYSPSRECIDDSYKKGKELYPKKKITFISWDTYDLDNLDYSSPNFLSNTILYCKCVVRSSHIFTSTTYRMKRYVSNQVLVDLNYYPAPFKNDLLSSDNKYYMGFETVGREYSWILFTSELAIRLEMPSIKLPHSSFLDFGLCRNDNLLSNDDCQSIKEELLSSLPYSASKIVLYIPTHRDYEQSETDVSRSLFGYSLDLNSLDTILRREGMMIVCKIHPKQNRAVISSALPVSIRIHEANHKYGLCELMKISDCLISDYSTGYFDYLLLDKPVILNFYDIDKYKEERGMTYNPVESIVAGDIVKSADDFFNALQKIEENNKKYREKRRIIKDLFFAYQDSNCCKRVFNYLFENKVESE